MAEFLHQVVKKREREMEMRGLLDFDSWTRTTQHGFSVPTIPIPPANEIAYRFHTMNGVTEHSVIFPNVNSWIQSVVMINTPASVTLNSPQQLALNAWELLAGHPCRPNYTWNNNVYTCRACSGTYTTHGSEWQHGQL
jgi:hypothetical protein